MCRKRGEERERTLIVKEQADDNCYLSDRGLEGTVQKICLLRQAQGYPVKGRQWQKAIKDFSRKGMWMPALLIFVTESKYLSEGSFKRKGLILVD